MGLWCPEDYFKKLITNKFNKKELWKLTIEELYEIRVQLSKILELLLDNDGTKRFPGMTKEIYNDIHNLEEMYEYRIEERKKSLWFFQPADWYVSDYEFDKKKAKKNSKTRRK